MFFYVFKNKKPFYLRSRKWVIPEKENAITHEGMSSPIYIEN